MPYNSWGNGSAMRVSPVGWYCDSIDDVLAEAQRSAEVTHNHPEGIKGAQAAAAAVYLARTGKSKAGIKQFVIDQFGYNLDRTVDTIRPVYEFDESCQGSVPEAIIAFLESTGYENAVRLAVSLGGDSDTIAAITGGIAEAFYEEIPEDIADFVQVILGPDLMKDAVIPFSEKYKKCG
jgi:ADP-ribosylglycohydrolase